MPEKSTDLKPIDDLNSIQPKLIASQTESKLQKINKLTKMGSIKEIIKEEVALPEKPVIEMTRQQLYNEIWEISVAGVAKKYEIPYSQLMKQVKEAAIPIPPSGYWTMLIFGKPVTKPEITDPVDAIISLYRNPSRIRSNKTEDDVKGTKAWKEENKTQEKEQDLSLSVRPCSIETIDHPIIDTISAQDSQTSSISLDSMTNEQTKSALCGQNYNVYDRATLYQEVWEAPVTEVAKRYNVSDVAIHKVCKALEIPTPPTGYWAKLRAGKPVSVIPLPQSDKTTKKAGMMKAESFQPEENEGRLSFLSDEERSVILSVASQILLPNEKTRMHPTIIEYRKAVEEWKKQKKDSANRNWNKQNSSPAPVLADAVSNEVLPRVCRIIDALIKAMEPLGCQLTNSLDLLVNGESVKISFTESKNEVNHIPTKDENIQILKYEEERKRHSWASKPQIRKYDHVFNGRLSLTVNSQKNFRDCKSYILEERLGDIMIEVYEAAEILKKAREAREEAERLRQEEECRKAERRKRYNLEIDRTVALTNLAEDYDTACKIWQYIAAVEAMGIRNAESARWIEWAKNKADWYDPTVAKKDEFFGKREHEKGADEKKLQHKSYWW